MILLLKGELQPQVHTLTTLVHEAYVLSADNVHEANLESTEAFTPSLHLTPIHGSNSQKVTSMS